MTALATRDSTSSSLPIGPIDQRLWTAVRAALNDIDIVDGKATTIALPSPVLRRAIDERFADVQRALMPLQRSDAEKKRAGVAVAAMLAGWIGAKVADPAAKVQAYVAVLGDLPSWAVERACLAVARGHVDGLSPDFPPSAARLHQLGAELVEVLRREADDLHRVRVAEHVVTITPEERARVGAKFKDLGEELTRRDVAEKSDSRAGVQRSVERNDAEIEREWRGLGLKPMQAAGRPISVALAKLLDLHPAPLAEAAE
jgi:hypothetical protein